MTVALTAASGSKNSSFSVSISKDQVVKDTIIHKLAARRLIKYGNFMEISYICRDLEEGRSWRHDALGKQIHGTQADLVNEVTKLSVK